MSNDQKNKNKIIVTPYVELDDEEDVYKIRLITIYDKSEGRFTAK